MSLTPSTFVAIKDILGRLAGDVQDERTLVEHIDLNTLAYAHRYPGKARRGGDVLHRKMLLTEVAKIWNFDQTGYVDEDAFLTDLHQVMGYRHEALIQDMRAYLARQDPRGDQVRYGAARDRKSAPESTMKDAESERC